MPLEARFARRVATIILLLISLSCGGSPPTPVIPSPLPVNTGAACGQERWAVKTLTDADALRVDVVNLMPTTIAALNAVDQHCSSLPDTRTFAEEFRVYEVTGIVQLTRNEDDRDVHVALADPADVSQTIVVEVLDPTCPGAAQSPFVFMLTQARMQYQSLGPLPGRAMRVRGVGFFDFAHGQTGRSRSCVELHPVLSISAP